MEIFEIKTAEELECCFSVLKGLRTELSFQDFIYIDDLVVIESARSNGLGARLLHLAEKTAIEMVARDYAFVQALAMIVGRNFMNATGGYPKRLLTRSLWGLTIRYEYSYHRRITLHR